jgi:hypothetical protein
MVSKKFFASVAAISLDSNPPIRTRFAGFRISEPFYRFSEGINIADEGCACPPLFLLSNISDRKWMV